MRDPPQWTNFQKYPTTTGTMLLALGVTLAAWGKVDITPLYESIAIRQGELWRIITSALPHANLLHLAFNLYWVWVFGTLVEEVFSHLRTAAIFLLFALVANGSEYAILSGGIGLSGVGYGLFGLLWVLSRRHPKFAGVVDTKTISLFVIWFFACIVMTAAGMPIGNIAHGAGAAIGALLGYTIISAGFRHRVGEAAIAGIVLAVMLGATMARPWINLSADRGDDEARLGYAALIAGRNDEALRWYRDATRMKPKTAGSWFNLGITLERLNRESESSAAYNRAYELEPSNPAFQSMALSRGNSRAIR